MATATTFRCSLTELIGLKLGLGKLEITPYYGQHYLPVTIGGKTHVVTFVSELGEGVFSHVYLIRSIFDGRSFAMKVAKPGGEELLEREYQVLRVLPPSNYIEQEPYSLVRFFDDTQPCVGMVMKLYSGNLAQFIHVKELKEVFAFQMLDILKHLLEKKIYHIDLKLENFLVDNYHLVLSDFGGIADVLEHDGGIYNAYLNALNEIDEVRDGIMGDRPDMEPEIQALQIRMIGMSLIALYTGDKKLTRETPDIIEKRMPDDCVHKHLILRMVEPDRAKRITPEELLRPSSPISNL